MATQLLDSLDADWDPKQYHDTYTEELRKRIKAKDSGKKVVDDGPGGAGLGEDRRPDGGPRAERRGRQGPQDASPRARKSA